jgi:hypothetical protein
LAALVGILISLILLLLKVVAGKHPDLKAKVVLAALMQVMAAETVGMVVILREVTLVEAAAALVAMLETVEMVAVIRPEQMVLVALLAAEALRAVETKNQVQAAVLVSLVKEAMAVAV